MHRSRTLRRNISARSRPCPSGEPSSFGRLGRGPIALPCGRVRVRQHKVSERCPFALGREIETASGEINGPRELMTVEIELRQKEMTFGKTRVAADGRLVGLQLRVAIAESFI